ncbi:class I SAM-dependent methyltransferase [Actinomadura viridis]|uniref:class I SAM-dependent methyltransferase n=1 Tax=Actinomadura viridis TaxID=58110 RepID=UPI0036B00FDF
MASRPGMSGEGPGPITPDGSAVELYAALPPGPEADIIHAALPPGASILELGAGTGRVTRELIARGHPVVAVDESPEMLAHVEEHVSGAETVCGTIEDLDLGRRFDAVLLASRLINVADARLAHRMLLSCRRHLSPEGSAIIERHAPGWFDQVRAIAGEGGGITMILREVDRPGPDLVAVDAEYRLDGRTWKQSFLVRRVDDEGLINSLQAAGLAFDSFLTPSRTWIKAVPDGGAPFARP